MQLSLITIAALLTGAAGAVASASVPVLHLGGHGQGGQGRDIVAKLQGIVESECNSGFVCPESITDCANIEKPEKPTTTTNWWNMSEEEKAVAKAEMQATKDTFKQQVLVCACCGGKTVQELVGYDLAHDEDGSETSSSHDGGTGTMV